MILVIGSTGNIGKHVFSYLKQEKQIVKEGLYKPEKETDLAVNFDFLDYKTFDKALKDVEKVFFIRPPQLGDPKDIYPFLDACKDKSIKQVVFVSLMGVEKKPIPPHAKIEKYIKKINLDYTFIRPSFFMENLIFPHGKDIKASNQIIVPAKKSKTSFIAAKDIGAICAHVLIHTTDQINQAYTITGPEALDYVEVAKKFSKHLNRQIIYTNPSMRVYGKHMIELGFDKGYVKITKLLYFMTRLGTTKKTTQTFETIMKRKPTTMDEFIKDNLNTWTD